jgi:hypothetical protein
MGPLKPASAGQKRRNEPDAEFALCLLLLL